MAMTGRDLRQITDFQSLVEYLRDELDWPLETDDLDEITFDYLPHELGLKDDDAVKVKHIYQLRPLAGAQPWGIFLVEFEQKKLPVAVLRRILSHLVVKKRTTANAAEQKRWQLHDLLFISAFGEEDTDQREIAFAHFHQENGDLPTLRVLGWDGADTPLKLEHVDATLRQTLCWPADEANQEAWRAQWRAPFRHGLGHSIRTADELADRLAALAKRICAAAKTLMAHETAQGALRQLHKAFQTALIHDLTEEDFADTYAQTITYGLLTAAITQTQMNGGQPATITADTVSGMVITNPFLREMLQTFLTAGGRKGGIDFDELGVQDVVELLRDPKTDLPAILRDFGNRTQGEDPVIHFYEHFLAAYNKKLKVKRGVFYTPRPVVSYIVRSVHELLQTEFGLEDGLASTVTWGEMAERHPDLSIPAGTSPDAPFVVILDPATGTATFLVEVIEVIHRTLTAKWKQQGLTEAQRREAWNAYVPQHLLPRLYGYELMMAPYAIAHMKMGLKLYETGYSFGCDERVRVYLTNALEPANDEQRGLEGIAEALAHEAQAVNAIKRHQRFNVIIGNPPYKALSANMTQAARRIVDPYRYVDGIRIKERSMLQFEKNIQDDYIKFLSLSQRVLAGLPGIIALITNHSYLDGPTLRGVRWNLMQDFTTISILDLHGNSNKGEIPPAGCIDKNVFDIKQGVAITFLSRPILIRPLRVFNTNIWGDRATKYRKLMAQTISTTNFNLITPSSPFYYLGVSVNR